MASTVIREKTLETSFQELLRLRKPDGNISWLLFSERRRTVSDNSLGGEVMRETVEIRVDAIDPIDRKKLGNAPIMKMRGDVNGFTRTVNFSDGYIVVEDPWKGMHIGTYMMNCLVAWARERYQFFRPVGISLTRFQAQTEEKKKWRNRFYERFGFRFVWTDDEEKEGFLDPELRVSDLSPVESWQTYIEIFSVSEAMHEVLEEARHHYLDLLIAEQRIRSAEDRLHAALTRDRGLRMRSAILGIVGILLGAMAARLLA